MSPGRSACTRPRTGGCGKDKTNRPRRSPPGGRTTVRPSWLPAARPPSRRAGGKAGDLLPSIRELAQSLAVNPTTVVRAYSELEAERVIEMQHGRGAFVADAARRMTAAKREQALRRSARQLAVGAFQIGG